MSLKLFFIHKLFLVCFFKYKNIEKEIFYKNEILNKYNLKNNNKYNIINATKLRIVLYFSIFLYNYINKIYF